MHTSWPKKQTMWSCDMPLHPTYQMLYHVICQSWWKHEWTSLCYRFPFFNCQTINLCLGLAMSQLCVYMFHVSVSDFERNRLVPLFNGLGSYIYCSLVKKNGYMFIVDGNSLVLVNCTLWSTDEPSDTYHSQTLLNKKQLLVFIIKSRNYFKQSRSIEWNLLW